MESFRTWLAAEEQNASEGITDTGQVATFARPAISYVRRQFVDPFFKKRKQNTARTKD